MLFLHNPATPSPYTTLPPLTLPHAMPIPVGGSLVAGAVDCDDSKITPLAQGRDVAKAHIQPAVMHARQVGKQTVDGGHQCLADMRAAITKHAATAVAAGKHQQIGRASCRERVCQYV